MKKIIQTQVVVNKTKVKKVKKVVEYFDIDKESEKHYPKPELRLTNNFESVRKAFKGAKGRMTSIR